MSEPRFDGCRFSAGAAIPQGERTGFCFGCAERVPSMRRRWCSDKCRDAWYENHIWSMASAAAKRRDNNSCRKCGRTAVEIMDDYKATNRRIERSVTEVNHIVPCRGAHDKNSCAHHLDNLETLCHDCHLKVTAEQRKSGALSRRSPQKRSRYANRYDWFEAAFSAGASVDINTAIAEVHRLLCREEKLHESAKRGRY